MNNSKQDILNNLIEEPFINQRILAAQTGHSLGIVNRSIKELISEGYLDEEIRPTEKTLREAKEKAPKNAIILAAGFGMRMVPINTETPKGLLEIKGERLIERTIRQLHEVGITEIYVVVGFMKEQYEYLIDEYGVELIVAPDYVSKKQSAFPENGGSPFIKQLHHSLMISGVKRIHTAETNYIPGTWSAIWWMMTVPSA